MVGAYRTITDICRLSEPTTVGQPVNSLSAAGLPATTLSVRIKILGPEPYIKCNNFGFGITNRISVNTSLSVFPTSNPIGDESNPMDECKLFKKDYDKCFNTWFRDKFLKGNNDDSMCSELLKNYTGCVKKAMKDKDIDITELRQYHTIIGSKDENHHEPYKKEN